MPAVPDDLRKTALTIWLEAQPSELGLDIASLEPASSDASFRRYFRVAATGACASYIVMDAPPDKEDCRPFVDVAGRLLTARVSVPHIVASNLEEGFLLLTDLGRTTYLERLDADTAPQLYGSATDALVRIQAHAPTEGLAPYDEAMLMRELELFAQWYLWRHRQRPIDGDLRAMLDATFGVLVADAAQHPRVLVHRDYHSRNLMVLDGDLLQGTPGIIDFQDAVLGPIAYDLVSLLRDAYIAWGEEEVIDWAVRYWEKARRAGLPVDADFGEFFRQFEWIGLQRHLKVLGIFARLSHRDGKDGYLADLPRVFADAQRVARRYRVFAPLARLLDALAEAPTQTAYSFGRLG